MRKPLLLLRMTVAGGLLSWLLARQDLSVVAELFRSIPLANWGYAIAATWLGIVISAARFLVVLRGIGVHVGLATLSRICLAGVFMGHFLPSTVGGDAVKFAAVRTYARRRLDVVIAILADRTSGLAAILIVATVGAFAYEDTFVSQPVLIGLLAVDVLFLAGIAVAVGWKPVEPEGSAKPRSWLARFVGWIRDAHATLHTIGRDSRVMLGSIALSLLFVGQVVMVSYIFAQGLGLSVGLGELATITAFVQLATMAPVGFNGVGVREWGFVLLLSWIDIPSEAALSLSLMIYFTVVLASLPGALLLAEGMRSGLQNEIEDER